MTEKIEISTIHDGVTLCGSYTLVPGSLSITVEMTEPYKGIGYEKSLSRRKLRENSQEYGRLSATEMLVDIYQSAKAIESNLTVYQALHDDYIKRCLPAIEYYDLLDANLFSNVIRIPITPQDLHNSSYSNRPLTEQEKEYARARRSYLDAMNEYRRLERKYLSPKNLPPIYPMSLFEGLLELVKRNLANLPG